MRRAACVLFLAAAFFIPADSAGQQKKEKEKKAPAKPHAPAGTIKAAKDFKVELLYTVPKETQGSWVNLCTDPKGRIFASDQYGPLYRVTPPPVGTAGECKVEQIKADIGDAQGLLWAFDALYVVVNSGKRKAGLYRVTDSDNDDMPDKVELLRDFAGGGGEHGPHAVMLHPDKKRLTIVCGNQTKLLKYDTTRVPPVWGEDHLLPRMPDGNNFMRGVLGPGGAMYNTTPDGKTWELVSVGFRNQYDAAYNRAGDLFTYDADMEWDMNTPWYRPTRVCLVTSGSEFGWRNGAGKYPPYYADNLPGVVDIGPGSPTGVCFGYGAKFPAKYQNAFFVCDWSYGKMYAVHMDHAGSAYKGTAEEFVTGSPLALTDAIINPTDGAMYFAVGGRRTQSALYRVTYTGAEPTAEAPAAAPPQEHNIREAIELSHCKPNPKAVESSWPHLGSPDRFLRFAARVDIEHQAPAGWAEKALAEKNPAAKITALLALCRTSAPCPQHAKPNDDKPDAALAAKIVAALNAVDFAKLTTEQKLELIRVYQVLFNRFGSPAAADRDAVLAKFDAVFPTKNRYIDGELLPVYVFLGAPTAAAKGMALLAAAPTQEEQMEYARSLRVAKTGWTPPLREAYFKWFTAAAGFRGGNSLRGFLKIIKDDAIATLTDAEKAALKPVIDAIPAGPVVASGPPRPFVKKWDTASLTPKMEAALKGGRDFDRGRKLFGEARCFACHRYDNDGSSYGPDLSGVAGRFAPKDLLESVLDPNKEVSDQYAATVIETHSGKKVIGRVVNLNGDNMSINTDMLDPNAMTPVNRGDIDKMYPSKQSMMPAGLMDVLKEDEVFDLLAYLLSRGDRAHAMFKK